MTRQKLSAVADWLASCGVAMSEERTAGDYIGFYRAGRLIFQVRADEIFDADGNRFEHNLRA